MLMGVTLQSDSAPGMASLSLWIEQNQLSRWHWWSVDECEVASCGPSRRFRCN